VKTVANGTLKSGLLSLLMLLAGGTVARAEVIVEASAASHYIFRGQDMLDGQSPVLIPFAGWSIGETGLEVNTWAYFAMTNRRLGWVSDSDEIDGTISYTRSFGPWMAQAGLFHLSLFKLDGWPDDATTVNELFLDIGRPDWPFMPVVSVAYELDEWEDHDTYFQLRAGHEFVMTDALVYVGASVGFWSYGWDSIPPPSDDGVWGFTRREQLTDFNVEVATTTVHDGWALTPKIVLTMSPDEVINPNQLVIWGSLAVTRSLGR
jgi:hypothetical protein